MAINHHRTHFGPGSPWTTFQPLAPGNHQRSTRSAQLNLSPHLKGKPSIPPCTLYSRLQEWCIYGIIYHYAAFLLWNSIVTLSGPRSQEPTPILKEGSLAHQSGNLWLQSEDLSMIPITWPCRSWVGNSSRIIPGATLRSYTLFE
ncbi:hypothetical protein O181_034657 [Austropuccinia psidii MF-1]|uniref:Uncharacterized protein n=1 Tax=Austropuccinia psidii MF-1 TaxID=1389203 RepID=A0A9Q3D721_9BASI|nr:hypothetical protein [Austropuccinia psidii MF-1]